jgi:uncharacterized protein YhdP
VSITIINGYSVQTNEAWQTLDGAISIYRLDHASHIWLVAPNTQAARAAFGSAGWVDAGATRHQALQYARRIMPELDVRLKAIDLHYVVSGNGLRLKLRRSAEGWAFERPSTLLPNSESDVRTIRALELIAGERFPTRKASIAILDDIAGAVQ